MNPDTGTARDHGTRMWLSSVTSSWTAMSPVAPTGSARTRPFPCSM